MPVNLLVRGRRVVVVGAGRIAARKIEPLLDLGADVVRGRTGRRRRGAGLGRRRALHSSPSASSRAADLDGAWLALTATDVPRRQRRRVRGGRGREGLGQQCRRPRQLLLYDDVGGPASRSGGRRRHGRPQSGAGHLPPAAVRTRRSALNTRSCSTCSPRPGKRCGRRGVPVKTPIGNGPSTPASLTWSAPGVWPTAKELLNSCL